MTQTDHKLIRTGWKGWLTLYGSWTIPPVLISVGFFLTGSGVAASETWYDFFISQLWFYYFFASLCPFMYRLGFRIEYSGVRWIRSVVVLLLIGIAALAAMHTVSAIMSLMLDSDVSSLTDALRDRFAGPATINTSFVGLFYYVAVIAITTIIRLHRQRQYQEAAARELSVRSLQLESQLSQAKLQVLRAQLRPHFLFNALNSISALIETRQNDTAYRAVAQLGGLLRATLDVQDTVFVSLEQEIAFIRDYLNIEQLRKGERLQSEISVSQESLQFPVPALILQPLVENAIHHGLTEQTKSLTVTIGASCSNSLLALSIADNGAGLPPNWTLSTENGIGLSHVRSQLHEIYGSSASLKIEPNKSGGVTAMLNLPQPERHGSEDD